MDWRWRHVKDYEDNGKDKDEEGAKLEDRIEWSGWWCWRWFSWGEGNDNSFLI